MEGVGMMLGFPLDSRLSLLNCLGTLKRALRIYYAALIYRHLCGPSKSCKELYKVLFYYAT